MGGGRKGDNSKFIFSKNNRERYRIHSDNLELVTIIERFSALPTQLRVKPQHPQQVLLSPRQPTICSTHNHHFFRKCKDLFHIMLAPLLSYLRHHSHCCLGILIVTVYITPATHNTCSIRLLHTSHWYTNRLITACRADCEIGQCAYTVTFRDIYVTPRNVVCTS